jgi:acyl transferase domain-containing protein
MSLQQKKGVHMKRKPNHNDFAIIGVACRFPDANNYQQYWQNLCEGINSVKEIPTERWDTQKYYSSDHQAPDKSVSKW